MSNARPRTVKGFSSRRANGVRSDRKKQHIRRMRRDWNYDPKSYAPN